MYRWVTCRRNTRCSTIPTHRFRTSGRSPISRELRPGISFIFSVPWRQDVHSDTTSELWRKITSCSFWDCGKEPNLLLLDEPLNHLDIPARGQFEEALSQYPGTIVVATHDRKFVDDFATSIWWIDRPDVTGNDRSVNQPAELRKFLDRCELMTSGALK